MRDVIFVTVQDKNTFKTRLFKNVDIFMYLMTLWLQKHWALSCVVFVGEIKKSSVSSKNFPKSVCYSQRVTFLCWDIIRNVKSGLNGSVQTSAHMHSKKVTLTFKDFFGYNKLFIHWCTKWANVCIPKGLTFDNKLLYYLQMLRNK